MQTQTETLWLENLPQMPIPACTREEAALLLCSLREDYQTLRPLARAQVKLLMAGLAVVNCSLELR
jgi:hypothetical protein